MSALFQSDSLQAEFEENGFVKVNLLSKSEVNKLTSAYQDVAEEHERIGIPYITTSHSNNADLITKVDTILQKVIGPALEKYLSNYKLLFGNFLIKMPGENSETEPHQDITFVDESVHSSVNIWVALQDIDENDGCMYFLKGSHKFMPTLRPTHDYPWVYDLVKEDIQRESFLFTAKAGDAFIFNHAVVHGSLKNKSKTPRLAAVIAAYPESAELIHYFLPPGEKMMVKKYLMTKDAYLSFVKHKPPLKGVYVGELKHVFRQLTKEEFKQILKSGKSKTGFLESIKQAIYG